MSARELYLDAASLFYFGYLRFETFDGIFRLADHNVSFTDPRWSPLLAEAHTAWLAALKASNDGRFSKGPLFAPNQQTIAAELGMLKKPLQN